MEQKIIKILKNELTLNGVTNYCSDECIIKVAKKIDKYYNSKKLISEFLEFYELYYNNDGLNDFKEEKERIINKFFLKHRTNG